MDKKKIMALLLFLGAAAAVYYFFLRGKLGGSVALALKPSPFGQADTQAYNQMQDLFKREADPKALEWLLPYVLQSLDGTNANPLSQDYYIDGKLSKAGAFVGEYARAYYGNPDSKFVIDKDDFNGKIYGIFNAFKSAYLQQKLGQA